MRSEGLTVESVCRVLRDQGVQIAARTYRAFRAGHRDLTARTVSDAVLTDVMQDAAWTVAEETGRRRRTPLWLYGRVKWGVWLRRNGHDASRGAVDRVMTALGLVGVRHGKQVRTTVPRKGDVRLEDLLDRHFRAGAPNEVWITDFTYVRSWAGCVYVALVVDVFAQRIVSWHAATSKTVDLVETPLRMAVWDRDR